MSIDVGPWLLNPVASIRNAGALTEAFIGQELLAYSQPGSIHEDLHSHAI